MNQSFAETFERVSASGLYEELHERGWLVPHVEVGLDLAATRDACKVLQPTRVPVVSYPYEWCPGQLREAALLTLRIQDLAVEHGMTLRDASAYNVQFDGTRPVFIDTLSFGPLSPGEPWVAYRQFCRHFLAPLALQKHVDVRLRSLLRTFVDGVPLDLAARLLPLRTKLSVGLLTHVHWQSRAARARDRVEEQRKQGARFSTRAMHGLIDSLRTQIGKLTWSPGRTPWSDYYAEATHYSNDAMRRKAEVVAGYLDHVTPRTVWDLGANLGRFSRLAAEQDSYVVAVDADVETVEASWRSLCDDPPESGAVLPLVMDLSNPSPALGWASRERESLLARGPADVVLALALLHHLAIANNVPLPLIAEFLAALARHVIVEFVPKSDPKVQLLLSTRADIFEQYSPEGFHDAFASRFDFLDSQELPGSSRTLHLLRRR